MADVPSPSASSPPEPPVVTGSGEAHNPSDGSVSVSASASASAPTDGPDGTGDDVGDASGEGGAAPFVPGEEVFRFHPEDGGSPVIYTRYRDEAQLPDMIDLFAKDLSEPYSIFTYRYFVHQWPELFRGHEVFLFGPLADDALPWTPLRDLAWKGILINLVMFNL